ncbi:FAD:protein FMN transferase [Pseudobacteroides cellulosolvens]|uniref:FAD:protein FMN transferase n=1 Tax=Pseudobacteroides cellulosolvens ATCC 35603 = DSM 2933 TaxID=398512 RepID=A0A0L6JRD1_9FIRM|nr:FAD:protein FMN transferase [Pseudobacteroides cellulosolvens]KNY28338.1 ApbE family lipoprotein [Pseudobacteroides cellulosolvens ATCC 35603 = DSM 2933]
MEANCVSKDFFSLGTVNSIKIYNCDDEELIERAITRVYEIDDLMSAYKLDSDISRLNRNSGKGFIDIHPDTFKVLNRAIEFSQVSSGAFDITIRPLVELWGIGRKKNFIPHEDDINRIKKLVNYKSVVLDKIRCQACLDIPGQAVDLGGIAKGFAADEVKRILLESDIENALINLGGNIVTIGNRPDGRTWQIGIQNPLEVTGSFLGILTVTDKTIVTSGCNERFFMKDGIRYHHILDPRTGMPAKTTALSITAIADCSMDADALTTASFILENGFRGDGLDLVRKLDAQVIIINSDGEVLITDGLKRNFKVRSRCYEKE